MKCIAKAGDRERQGGSQTLRNTEGTQQSVTSRHSLSSALAESLETLGFHPTEIVLGQGFRERHGFGATAGDCQFLVTFEGTRVTIVSQSVNGSRKEAAARASAAGGPVDSVTGLAEALYHAGIHLDAVKQYDEQGPARFDEASRNAA